MLLFSSILIHDNDLFLCVFTLLISNTAASLASGLAGCLAFATATVLCAFAKVTSFKSLNSFHCSFSNLVKLIMINLPSLLSVYHKDFSSSRIPAWFYETSIRNIKPACHIHPLYYVGNTAPLNRQCHSQIFITFQNTMLLLNFYLKTFFPHYPSQLTIPFCWSANCRANSVSSYFEL